MEDKDNRQEVVAREEDAGRPEVVAPEDEACRPEVLGRAGQRPRKNVALQSTAVLARREGTSMDSA